MNVGDRVRWIDHDGFVGTVHEVLPEGRLVVWRDGESDYPWGLPAEELRLEDAA